MDYMLMIGAVTIFIEQKIQGKINYIELEESTGFSLAHIRDVFANKTGTPLSKYIMKRKITYAAFDILHTNQNVFEIALKYGFDNPDTFTRAFKRVTGLTPREFRKQCPSMERIKLCAGVYGIGLKNIERVSCGKMKQLNESSGILYGVPKVEYGTYFGCTPFPICLKACSDYLGEDIGYDNIITSSGIAFRLVWDTTCWNGGNVDAIFTFDDYEKVWEMGMKAIGRKCTVLWRKKGLTKKEEFIAFIKQQIDQGVPCIALGIIGPPEACIITGYRDYGETLLGWNLFQDNPEFAGKVQIDESGYFISDTWWDNQGTIAVMAIGEREEKPSIKDVITNAVSVLEGRKVENYAKGILAYDAWKNAITNDREFPKDLILPVLAERLMCQGDAMDCLHDGRENASKFLQKEALNYPEYEEMFLAAAENFKTVAKNIDKMSDVLGGWTRGELQLKNMAKTEIRQQLSDIIEEAKHADKKGLDVLKEIGSSISSH